MKSKIVVASVAAALLLGATVATASAQTTTLCALSASTGAGVLQLNGVATWLSSGGLRLVPNSLTQSGSVYQIAPVPFSTSTSFHAAFSFRMSPRPAGADGIGFVLQNSAAGASALGDDGGGLGYQNVPSSVIIEFDTYRNEWDVNSNHVALMVDGDARTHLALATPPFALTSATVYAWVDYDGSAKQVAVFASTSATKPDWALLVAPIDYGLHVGAQAYVGFTASTGSDTNDHDLLSWEFSTDGVPCACLGVSACPLTAPSCGPAGVCAQCATDAECGSPTPRCEDALGRCVACVSDGDCGGTTPVCDLTTFTCEPCQPDGGVHLACASADAGGADAGGAGAAGADAGAGGAGTGGAGGAGTSSTAAAGGDGGHDDAGHDAGNDDAGRDDAGWPATSEVPNFVARCACRLDPQGQTRGRSGFAALALALVALLRRRPRPRITTVAGAGAGPSHE